MSLAYFVCYSDTLQFQAAAPTIFTAPSESSTFLGKADASLTYSEKLLKTTRCSLSFFHQPAGANMYLSLLPLGRFSLRGSDLSSLTTG